MSDVGKSTERHNDVMRIELRDGTTVEARPGYHLDRYGADGQFMSGWFTINDLDPAVTYPAWIHEALKKIAREAGR